MNADALRFSTAQCETRIADLHEQGIGTDRAACDNAHGLALDKAQFTKSTRNRVIVFKTADGIDDGWRKGRKIGQVHNIQIQIVTIYIDIVSAFVFRCCILSLYALCEARAVHERR